VKLDIAVVGIGITPVRKKSADSLRHLGAQAIRAALDDAELDRVDAIYVGNMLADEQSGQKHIAALLASHSGQVGTEALQVRAATASGGAALRVACLAVASGQVEFAMAAGVELMSAGPPPTHALALALDAEREIPEGLTLVGANANLMSLYLARYNVRYQDFANFAVNAHRNAAGNRNALFRDPVDADEVLNSRLVSPPLRLFDCSPICDGAAAVILCRGDRARQFRHDPVWILASAVATDRFAVQERSDSLALEAAQLASTRAYQQAGITPKDVDFFEVHDAFSIMSCLQLEASGFAERGAGWRLAAEGDIFREGRLPICTMGGLKARGHPIGASALYQVAEIVLQMRGQAGTNQLAHAEVALTHSVGGAGTTIVTHILAREAR